MYGPYRRRIDDSSRVDGEGADMHSNEFLAVIKADRERDIRAAHRVRLLDRKTVDGASDPTPSPDTDRMIGRIIGRFVQAGRTTADPSS